MKRPLYEALASAVQARLRCAQNNNKEWFDKHSERIRALVKEHMPSGSGFDAGTTLDLDESHAEKLVFKTSFHHMDEHGGYDGWTEHSVTVTPSFIGGFDLKIGGRDRNGIKEYIGETFHHVLSESVE